MLDKLGKRKFIIPFVLPVLVVCLFSLMFCPMAQMELRNLPVAVVNLDEGIELPSGTLNIGSEITEGLESGEGIEGTSVSSGLSATASQQEENASGKEASDQGSTVMQDALLWSVLESEESAESAFANHNYYALIVIPKDFTLSQIGSRLDAFMENASEAASTGGLQSAGSLQENAQFMGVIAQLKQQAAEVEDGSTYTLGDAQYGYYTDGKIYKPGTVLTITGDIALTSIDSLSVDMANGAAIKLSTPAGLKFQAKVSSNNGEAVKSDAIKEGMLITANDIYENNSSALDLTSPYAMLNIVNEGWFDESAMTYCGAVANISEANYTRDFIARAYVTITYTDNTSVTVYSGMSQTRSVSYVASAVKAAGYPGIAASEIPVVDSFIK